MHCISDYIVQSDKNGLYPTIQDAINAAKKSGGGTVYLKPGIYFENLTLFEKVDIWGAVGASDTKSCVIIGKHQPPIEGSFTIRNVFLQSEKSIFESEWRGTSSIFLINCIVSVKDGYVFNLPNWTAPGKFVGFDMGDCGSIENGFINNENGADVLFVCTTVGAGLKRKMVISGTVNFFTVEVQCALVFLKNAFGNVASGCCFRNSITFQDFANLTVINSGFLVSDRPAIVYNSKSKTIISDCTIDGMNNPIIEGNGKGVLKIGSVSFINNSNIADSVNLHSGDFRTGNLLISEVGKGITIPEGLDAKMGIVKLSFGQAIIYTKMVKKNSRIFLTPQLMGSNTGTSGVELIVPGESIKVRSSNIKDDSILAWLIVDPH